MLKEQSSHIIHTRFLKMKKNWRLIKASIDKEGIHRFRVEYKKLRAFLRLLASAKGDNAAGIPKALKEVYRQAGKVRDLQLHLNPVEGALSGKGLLSRKKLLKESDKLRALLKPGLLHSAEIKITGKMNQAISDKNVEAFVGVRLNNISQLVSKGIRHDTEMHSVRKYLKDIIYVAKIYQVEEGVAFPVHAWNEETEQQYLQIASELGRYQDRSVSIIHLRHDLQKRMDVGAQRRLLSLLQDQSQARKSLKQTLAAYFTGRLVAV